MLPIFIIFVFLIVIFTILRFEHTFSKIKLVLILVILLILISSAVLWANSSDADFSTSKSTFFSALSYFSWVKSTGMVLINTGSNAFKDIGALISKDTNTTSNFDGRR